MVKPTLVEPTLVEPTLVDDDITCTSVEDCAACTDCPTKDQMYTTAGCASSGNDFTAEQSELCYQCNTNQWGNWSTTYGVCIPDTNDRKQLVNSFGCLGMPPTWNGIKDDTDQCQWICPIAEDVEGCEGCPPGSPPDCTPHCVNDPDYTLCVRRRGGWPNRLGGDSHTQMICPSHPQTESCVSKDGSWTCKSDSTEACVQAPLCAMSTDVMKIAAAYTRFPPDTTGTITRPNCGGDASPESYDKYKYNDPYAMISGEAYWEAADVGGCDTTSGTGMCKSEYSGTLGCTVADAAYLSGETQGTCKGSGCTCAADSDCANDCNITSTCTCTSRPTLDSYSQDAFSLGCTVASNQTVSNSTKCGTIKASYAVDDCNQQKTEDDCINYTPSWFDPTVSGYPDSGRTTFCAWDGTTCSGPTNAPCGCDYLDMDKEQGTDNLIKGLKCEEAGIVYQNDTYKCKLKIGADSDCVPGDTPSASWVTVQSCLSQGNEPCVNSGTSEKCTTDSCECAAIVNGTQIVQGAGMKCTSNDDCGTANPAPCVCDGSP